MERRDPQGGSGTKVKRLLAGSVQQNPSTLFQQGGGGTVSMTLRPVRSFSEKNSVKKTLVKNPSEVSLRGNAIDGG